MRIIEGNWTNSNESIKIRFMKTPNESDTFSVEYSDDKKSVNGKIHLSYSGNNHFHLVDLPDQVLFGEGSIIFLKDDRILIRTRRIKYLSLNKNDND